LIQTTFLTGKNRRNLFDYNVLHAVLLSNMKVTIKFFTNISRLRSIHVSLSLFQNLNKINCNNNETFLWFNKYVKYKGKPLYYKEFFDAGIVDALQLVDANGNYRSYDDVASTFNLSANNESFIKYIKLMSAIPENWNLNSVLLITKKKLLRVFWKKCKFSENLQKSCYNYLFSKFNSTPTKQQVRWNQDLNISINSEEWLDIYKCNYQAAQETKLRLFQIKLNLRGIVTNIALHGFELVATDNCIFVIANRKRLFIFFVLVI